MFLLIIVNYTLELVQLKSKFLQELTDAFFPPIYIGCSPHVKIDVISTRKEIMFRISLNKYIVKIFISVPRHHASYYNTRLDRKRTTAGPVQKVYILSICWLVIYI